MGTKYTFRFFPGSGVISSYPSILNETGPRPIYYSVAPFAWPPMQLLFLKMQMTDL